MAQIFPFTSTQQTDPETDEVGSLHHRLDVRGSQLKVFYTNTSAEYHRGDASLIHTDVDGTRDVDPGPNTLVYHFTGTEHSLGSWPPTDVAESGDGENRSRNLRGVVDYAPLLRACLVNLDQGISKGIEPPASRHPRIDDGTAVPPSELKQIFDRMPGAYYPEYHGLPRRRDYGLKADPEQVSLLPPAVGKPYGSVVSAVDADGSEVAGIILPEIAVPLATHTGWTLRHPDIGGERQLLVFAGGTIPFAVNAEGRRAIGDPRVSIYERYASKDDYLKRVRRVAEELVQARYLLEEDVGVCLTQAGKFWDHFAEGKVG